jgi:hypothetical protein
LSCGCSSEQKPPEPPFKVFQVTGKVVYKDGSSVERLQRSRVWFQSTSDPNVKAVGGISDDGSFRMTVLVEDKGFAGVPEGRYQVRVDPGLDDERNPQRHLFHPKHSEYSRSGVTVTVPVADELVIELERAR